MADREAVFVGVDPGVVRLERNAAAVPGTIAVGDENSPCLQAAEHINGAAAVMRLAFGRLEDCFDRATICPQRRS
jgi:hypothetical protein